LSLAIETKKLTKRFPRSIGYMDLLPKFIRKRQWIHAVQDVSLDIKDGELFGLLGPNGAGKTTLMKMLCTLILPTSGRATCYGYDVVRDEQRVKQTVGFVSTEERSFYWRLTGRQNLEFYASLYHIPARKMRQRITELLSLVDLTEHADRRFDSYSTGMRQKLAIARGLLNNPGLLFVDEPTKSLDPVSAQSVREFLREKVVGAGRTVILATHQMAEAEQLCDRLAIMNLGRVIAVGSIKELRAVFQTQEKCQLEVRNLADSLLARLHLIPGIAYCYQPNQSNGVTNLEILLSDRRAALPEVMRLIVESGGDIFGCSIIEATLEEILASALRRTNQEAG
jgi:ABC-2 type transport system ATP-binding protein